VNLLIHVSDFGGWTLDTSNDRAWAAANFSDSNRDDLFVAGENGIAVLRYDAGGRTFSVAASGDNGDRFNGWLLSTRDNRFAGFMDLTGDNYADVLVSSGWGISIFSQNGSSFDVPVISRNGTRFGGWLLNTWDNKFW